jgi:uncharacterized repeat protein (TIGR01451 family)
VGGADRIATASALSDLRVTQSSPLIPTIADQPITYTIVVDNLGPDPASNVILKDTFPSKVIFGSASAGGTYDRRTHSVTWNVGIVANGASIQESVTLTPIRPDDINNVVDVTSATPDSNPTNNSGPHWNQVIGAPGTFYVTLRASDPNVFSPPIDGPPFIPPPPLTVQWNFFGPTDNSVKDAHGMNFVDSGNHSPVSYYSQDFTVTSEFRIKDETGHRFKLAIPVDVVPRQGTTSDSFQVIGASAPLPTGFELAYHIMTPGTGGKFVVWHRTTATSLVFDSSDPFFDGPGTYSFSSRLLDTMIHTQDKLGPKITVQISP